MTSSLSIILPPHKFEHPWRWYFRLSETERYEFGAASNGMTPIPDFMIIYSDAIIEIFERMDTQREPNWRSAVAAIQNKGEFFLCSARWQAFPVFNLLLIK
jgi:hypothetical protein